ncbi:MAG TPA: hypothetical protein VL574_04665 [Stellaceae bacterium]|nr:hypothetical protein [Stellaceae bacterium]
MMAAGKAGPTKSWKETVMQNAPPNTGKHDAGKRGQKPGMHKEQDEQARKAHHDRKLDEALDDSFPASDPPSITTPAPSKRDAGHH